MGCCQAKRDQEHDEKVTELTSGGTSDVGTHPTSVRQQHAAKQQQTMVESGANPLQPPGHLEYSSSMSSSTDYSTSSSEMEAPHPAEAAPDAAVAAPDEVIVEDEEPAAPAEQRPDDAMAPAGHNVAEALADAAEGGEWSLEDLKLDSAKPTGPLRMPSSPSRSTARGVRAASRTARQLTNSGSRTHEDSDTPPLPSTPSNVASSVEHASATLSGAHVQNLMSYMSLMSTTNSMRSNRSESDPHHSSVFMNGRDGWSSRSARSLRSSVSPWGGGGGGGGGGGRAFGWLVNTSEGAVTPLVAIMEDAAALGEKATSEAGSSESGSLNSMDPDYGEQWARRLQKARPLNAEERDAALGRWLGNIVANLPPPRRLSQDESLLTDTSMSGYDDAQPLPVASSERCSGPSSASASARSLAS